MTNTVTFHRGDVRDVMATMPDHSVDLLVTSPPFLALRSYLPADHPDKHREIGSEATPAAFLDTMLGLTAVWRRLVTSTGSIAVEIGDTYSGGWVGPSTQTDERDNASGGPRLQDRRRNSHEKRNKLRESNLRGWPLPKSLCGIPTLYAWSLAYGCNLLTGEDSPAGRWRIRNLLTWTRPNPPVGALGDKYRPATSFVTVACVSDRRWFDLDAVRTGERSIRQPSTPPNPKTTEQQNPTLGWATSFGAIATYHADGGAPPLDWWDDDTTTSRRCRDNHRHFGHCLVWRCGCDCPNPDPDRDGLAPDDWQPLHRLPTAPYTGSHYAAYPIALPRRLIESMCPKEVCVVCGEPRRRIVGEAEYVRSAGGTTGKRRDLREPDGCDRGIFGGVPTMDKVVATLGWTDCDHDDELWTEQALEAVDRISPYRPGVVFDPFAGSGTTAVAAALAGRDAVLIDLDARNVDLCRRRLAETMLIVSEVVDGNAGTVTWTVRHDMPGTKNEAAGQLSMFAEEAS